MAVDIEEILGRELREVASGLHVPVAPALAAEPSRPRRHLQALLVAAVVVLIVATAIAMDAFAGGDRELEPAPLPGRSEVSIPTTAPTTPYVLDRKLYVGGEQVPGAWSSVLAGAEGWVAVRLDNSWWRGTDAKPYRIDEDLIGSVAISPNGRYVGEVLGESVEGDLSGFDSRPGAEGFGATPIDLGEPGRTGDPVYVRAVTDDGRVIAQGLAASVLWLPLVNGDKVNLADTASDQLVLGNTTAGLVVTDGEEGPAYLGEISDTGEIIRTHDLPDLDTWAVSPDARWLAWTPRGSIGGETGSLSTLQLQAVGGGDEAPLVAPAGWAFRVLRWVWEDDDHLVSVVVRDDGGSGERLARCSVDAGRCVLIDSP